MSLGGYDMGPVIPNNTGTGYDITRGLGAPGQRHPARRQHRLWQPRRRDDRLGPGNPLGRDPNRLGPAWRTKPFHGNTQGPQIAGTKAGTNHDENRNGKPLGPTADQIVADVIAGDTPHRVLAYRVQAASRTADASWMRLIELEA